MTVEVCQPLGHTLVSMAVAVVVVVLTSMYFFGVFLWGRSLGISLGSSSVTVSTCGGPFPPRNCNLSVGYLVANLGISSSFSSLSPSYSSPLSLLSYHPIVSGIMLVLVENYGCWSSCLLSLSSRRYYSSFLLVLGPGVLSPWL